MDVTTWPEAVTWPQDPGAYLLDLRLAGNPATKLRAQVTSGNAYTPAATRRAEAEWQRLIRRALPRGFGVDDTHQWAVRMVFYAQDHRHRDWDNYAKLICDAGTGLVWQDDYQVTYAEVAVIRAHPEPQSLLRVLRREPLALQPRPKPTPRRSPAVDRLTVIRAARAARSYRVGP